MKKILAILMILCAAAVFAEDKLMPRFTVPTAWSNGMGGAHTAYTDDVFALLVNPAALIRAQQRSVFSLSPSILSPETALNLIDPVSSAVGGGSSTTDIIKSFGSTLDAISGMGGKIPLGASIREFPLSIAYAANGFGFGLWNTSSFNVNVQGLYVHVSAFEDVILPIGFAFRIYDNGSQSVDAGFTVKGFGRAMASASESILNLASGNTDSLTGSLSVPLIVGGGVDLGLMYRTGGFRLGLTATDVYTRGVVVSTLSGAEDTNNYAVPLNFNFGAAYDLNIGTMWTYAPRFLAKSGLVATFDWRDLGNIFDQDNYLEERNALLNMGLGLELYLGGIFKFRAGLNEMLPAVGAGIHLGFFKLDVAYYGRELGKEPGELSVAALDLTIAIRPEAKKKKWPWAKKPFFGGYVEPDEDAGKAIGDNQDTDIDVD
ncbi:hypothetical protein AGMMS49928_05370 [Spirochaetia bacterium]|nr:hypothetical protein AGMMS49928_05370 [Spirochaetia bacterium]